MQPAAMPLESLSQLSIPAGLQRGRAVAANRGSRSPSSAKPGATVSCGADIKITKRIHHRWTEVFRLVLDVESYPAFVPYCRDVQMLSRTAADQVRTTLVSRMSVGFAALHVDYVTRTVGDLKSRRIDINAINGPLRYLKAVWQFKADGRDWTEIEFSADYQFSNPLLAAVASHVFESMFGEVVNAFERRADCLSAAGANATRDRRGSASAPAARGPRMRARN
jgi:coenzyme Q-binding protein COQ10